MRNATSCVCTSQLLYSEDREGPSYLGQEKTFPGPGNDGLLGFPLESDSGGVLIWRERSIRYHQSNTVERHNYRGGRVMVWAGISLGGPIDLNVFQEGTLTCVRYPDEILYPYVRPYAGAIDNDFILMDEL
ncbi:transposable element Tcb2 transposase [Trichonephila clavipes]|nr:transposable element Tcb2 transposase [Trichonephila clavipes]